MIRNCKLFSLRIYCWINAATSSFFFFVPSLSQLHKMYYIFASRKLSYFSIWVIFFKKMNFWWEERNTRRKLIVFIFAIQFEVLNLIAKSSRTSYLISSEVYYASAIFCKIWFSFTSSIYILLNRKIKCIKIN